MLNIQIKKKVLVIEKAKNKFHELWVSSTYTRYRYAFRNFLDEYFQINSIPVKYQVDHIISRKIFLKNILNILFAYFY